MKSFENSGRRVWMLLPIAMLFAVASELFAAEPAVLAVEPSELSADITDGKDVRFEITIRNDGESLLRWKIESSPPWVIATVKRGKLRAGKDKKIKLRIDLTSVPAEGVTSDIIITAVGAIGSPATVQVALIGITPEPPVIDTPPDTTVDTPPDTTVDTPPDTTIVEPDPDITSKPDPVDFTPPPDTTVVSGGTDPAPDIVILPDPGPEDQPLFDTPPLDKPSEKVPSFGLRLGYAMPGAGTDVDFGSTPTIGAMYRKLLPSTKFGIDIGLDFSSMAADGYEGSVTQLIIRSAAHYYFLPNPSMYACVGYRIVSETIRDDENGTSESGVGSAVDLGIGMTIMKKHLDARITYSSIMAASNVSGVVSLEFTYLF